MLASRTRTAGPSASSGAFRPRVTGPRNVASDVLAVQRMAGNRAVCAILRIPVDVTRLERELEVARKALGEASRVAEDVIEAATGHSIRSKSAGKVSENWIRKRLGEIAAGGGKHAGAAHDALEEVERLRKEVGRLKDALEGIRPTPQKPYGSKKAEKARKHTERKKAGKAGGGGGGAPDTAPKADAPAPVSKASTSAPTRKTTTRPGWDATAGPPTHGKKGPNYRPAPVDKPAKLPPPPAKLPPVPATPPTTGGGGGGKVATEVGQAATEAAGKGRVFMKAAGKFGISVVNALIPDPTDAIALMINYLSAYEEAKAEIRRRNLRKGFAVGWAAYLVIPRWDWAKWFARTEVSRDVIALVLGAVGIAESAYNEGLVRGFIYGEKHSKRQADRARQRAFDALVKENRMPGRYEDDDTYTFGRDDVWAFASVMQRAANEVVDDADRRGAERLAAEARAREAEKYRKDFDEGHAPPGAREW